MLDAAIDHVAIAVRSLSRAVPLYTDVLGATFIYGGDNVEQGFRWAQFRFLGGGKIELITPLDPGGFLARFLDRHGEGVHHVTLKVPDIERALAALRAAGITPVGVSTDHPGWKEAFIHPRDANGTVIQLAQAAWSDEDWARHHLEGHDEDHHHATLETLLEDLPPGPVAS